MVSEPSAGVRGRNEYDDDAVAPLHRQFSPPEWLAEQDLLVSGGSVYPLLSRLEKAGLVASEKRPSLAGPPRSISAPRNSRPRRGVDGP